MLNVLDAQSDPHYNLAYRLARKHVLDRVGHALQAIEAALVVDERDELAWLGSGLGLGLGSGLGSGLGLGLGLERDELAARMQVEHALLAAGDGAVVLS